jgi:hypothetical protein
MGSFESSRKEDIKGERLSNDNMLKFLSGLSTTSPIKTFNSIGWDVNKWQTIQNSTFYM